MCNQIQSGSGDVTITNDGATILKQMQVLHPVARMVRIYLHSFTWAGWSHGTIDCSKNYRGGGGGGGGVINPRRACAARVTVLGLSVGQSVCVSVHDYSRTAGNEAASERYQQLQRNKRSKIKMAILLKQRRSRWRNWHYRGPRCVTQPIN